jgi:hypothetical protein
LLAFFKRLPNADKTFSVLPGSAHIAQFGLRASRFYAVLFGFLNLPLSELPVRIANQIQ